MNSVTIKNVFATILSDLESVSAGVVMAVMAVFMPQLLTLELAELETLGANFKVFLAALDAGKPWGEALADMMTADWNSVKDTSKQVSIDFVEALGTALEKLGLAHS